MDKNAVRLLALKRPLTKQEKLEVQSFMHRRKNVTGRNRSSAVSRTSVDEYAESGDSSMSLYMQQRRRSRDKKHRYIQQDTTSMGGDRRAASRFGGHIQGGRDLAAEAATAAINKYGGFRGGKALGSSIRRGGGETQTMEDGYEPVIVTRARALCVEMRYDEGEVSYMKLMRKLNREFGKVTTVRYSSDILNVMSESTMSLEEAKGAAALTSSESISRGGGVVGAITESELEADIRKLREALAARERELRRIREGGASPKSPALDTGDTKNAPAGAIVAKDSKRSEKDANDERIVQGLKIAHGPLVQALKGIRKFRDLAALSMKPPIGLRPNDVEPADATFFVKELLPGVRKALEKSLGRKPKLKDIRNRLEAGMLALREKGRGGPSSKISEDPNEHPLIRRTRALVTRDPRFSRTNVGTVGQSYVRIKAILVAEFGEDTFRAQKSAVSNILRAAVGLGGDERVAAAKTQSTKTTPVTPADASRDPRFAKYAKMRKMHIPDGAVEQKMIADGIGAADVDRFFGRAASVNVPTISPNDPRFAKYFKMKKMHIPKGAISQKMQADGISAIEIAAFFGDAVPGKSPRVKRKPRPYMTLFWQMIKKDRHPGSLWASQSSSGFISGVELKRHFGRDIKKATASSKRKKGVVKAKSADAVKRVKIFSADRMHTISIVISQVKILPVDLTNALWAMNRSVLSLDLVERFLFDVKMNASEAQSLVKYTGPSRYLSRIEQICRAVAIVPQWRDRLESLECFYTFSDDIKGTTETARSIRSLIRKVRRSKRLPVVLNAVLELGNMMNKGTELANAKGFKMSILVELAKSKSKVVKTYTLLHFVVESVERKAGADALAIMKDLASSPASAQIVGNGNSGSGNTTSLSVLSTMYKSYRQEIRRMQKRLDLAKKRKSSTKSSRDKFVATTTLWLKRAENELQASEKEWNATLKEFDDCMAWFGYDAKSDASKAKASFLADVLRFAKDVESTYSLILADRATKLNNLKTMAKNAKLAEALKQKQARLRSGKKKGREGAGKLTPRDHLRRIRSAVGSVSEGKKVGGKTSPGAKGRALLKKSNTTTRKKSPNVPARLARRAIPGTTKLGKKKVPPPPVPPKSAVKEPGNSTGGGSFFGGLFGSILGGGDGAA